MIFFIFSGMISSKLKIQVSFVILTGMTIFIYCLLPITRGILQGKKRFINLGINFVIEGALKLAGTIILIYVGWRVYGAITALIFGVVVAFLISLINIKDILKSKRTSNMLFLRLGLSFPVHPREIPLSIEILASSKPKTTEKVTLYSPYPDIPPVEMFVPSKEDMLANKVSAVYQRNRPRDVYDIALLLKLGATVDMKLIKKKIPKFNLNTFKKKLQEKQKAWKSLEPLVVTKLPKFKEQTRYIISFFQS